MVELMARGVAYTEAYAIVRRREQEDAAEYEQWCRNTGGDARYDDQFELDTDYN
jgi:hypothetical protein